MAYWKTARDSDSYNEKDIRRKRKMEEAKRKARKSIGKSIILPDDSDWREEWKSGDETR